MITDTMSASAVKDILVEAYNSVKLQTGIAPYRPGEDFKQILLDNVNWNVYVEAFADTLPLEQQADFKTLANNTRKALLEASISTLNPYETLSVPLLRIFWPRLIAKDAVTVTPITKPDTIKGFLHVTFQKYTGETLNAPSIKEDVSGGVMTSGTITIPGNIDLLKAVGLTSSVAHLQKNLLVVRATETTTAGTESVDVEVEPTVDNDIAFSVTFPTSGNTYTITGTVDFYNGIVHMSSDPAPATGVTLTVDVSGQVSLEENTINTKASFNIQKIRFIIKERKITGEWTTEFEQDVKALFDIDFQAQIVSMIGRQIATDIDREIILNLIKCAEKLSPSTHVDSFSKTPPATWTWGQRLWYENILPKLSNLSAIIYNDTQINGGNTILCNPVDATILEAINDFSYNGSAEDGGAAGYRSANVGTGKWKVLVSTIVPAGKMIINYTPQEEQEAIYVYAPYRPAVLMPYPLGATPTLTVMSRYADAVIRPKGVCVLDIT